MAPIYIGKQVLTSSPPQIDLPGLFRCYGGCLLGRVYASPVLGPSVQRAARAVAQRKEV